MFSQSRLDRLKQSATSQTNVRGEVLRTAAPRFVSLAHLKSGKTAHRDDGSDIAGTKTRSVRTSGTIGAIVTVDDSRQGPREPAEFSTRDSDGRSDHEDYGVCSARFS